MHIESGVESWTQDLPQKGSDTMLSHQLLQKLKLLENGQTMYIMLQHLYTMIHGSKNSADAESTRFRRGPIRVNSAIPRRVKKKKKSIYQICVFELHQGFSLFPSPPLLIYRNLQGQASHWVQICVSMCVCCVDLCVCVDLCECLCVCLSLYVCVDLAVCLCVLLCVCACAGVCVFDDSHSFFRVFYIVDIIFFFSFSFFLIYIYIYR